MARCGNRLLGAALRYADLGYRVFPCAPGDNKPITKHGFHDATVDPDQIERWWAERPNANIGLPTEGLLALDVDLLDGKPNPWLTPERQLDLARGPMQLTPGGGSHYLFRQPEGKGWRNTTSTLSPKVDTRADGGYIVVPPSARPDGVYRWQETMALDTPPDRLPEPPDWLTKALDTVAARAATSPPDASSAPDGNPIPSGQRNATLARLAGTMRRAGMAEPEILAAILQTNRTRCQPPLAETEVRKVAASISRYAPDEVTVAVAENHWGQMYEDEAEEAGSGPKSPGPFPTELIDRAPDIVRQAMDYYMSNAFEAQPLLFMASLIAATGAVLGHKVKDVSGLRTNIYTVGITPSGGGKEATREIVSKIFRHAGIPQMCGPEDFASDSGLIAAVCEQNPILFQLDEFGRLMHSINAGGGRSPHLFHIATVLLRFFSKAGGVFRSKAYADPKRNRVIEQPHVCVYGTTPRASFWRAMDAESLEGGFLPRLLIIEAKEDSIGGGALESDPPDEIVDFIAFWAHRKITPGNLESVHPRPMVVPCTPEAKGLLDDLRTFQKAEQKRHGDLGVLWSRARENAGKLAMIHACWKARDRPVIDAEAAQWAVDFVTHVVRHTVYEASLCLVEGPFHERCQKIMQALEAADGRRLKKRELTRATRSMTPRERGEALAALVEQGRLRIDPDDETGGRPATWYVAV